MEAEMKYLLILIPILFLFCSNEPTEPCNEIPIVISIRDSCFIDSVNIYDNNKFLFPMARGDRDTVFICDSHDIIITGFNACWNAEYKCNYPVSNIPNNYLKL